MRQFGSMSPPSQRGLGSPSQAAYMNSAKNAPNEAVTNLVIMGPTPVQAMGQTKAPRTRGSGTGKRYHGRRSSGSPDESFSVHCRLDRTPLCYGLPCAALSSGGVRFDDGVGAKAGAEET